MKMGPSPTGQHSSFFCFSLINIYFSRVHNVMKMGILWWATSTTTTTKSTSNVSAKMLPVVALVFVALASPVGLEVPCLSWLKKIMGFAMSTEELIELYGASNCYVCCNFGYLNLFNVLFNVFLGLSESFWIFVLCFGNGFVSNFNFLFIKITYIYNWSGECGIDLITGLEIGLIIEFITWVGLSITWLFS